MQALAIRGESCEVEELEITMQANTVYSFFNSILIDELSGINKHIIYTDVNALNEGKRAYFIGEQLILGDALIHAREGMEDSDVIITKVELESLVHTEVNDFYLKALELLSQSEISLYKTFPAQTECETLHLNAEWVLYTFNIADRKTREYFIIELEKTIDTKEDVILFIQKMAQLALDAQS